MVMGRRKRTKTGVGPAILAILLDANLIALYTKIFLVNLAVDVR
jgi:hypothetical protein